MVFDLPQASDVNPAAIANNDVSVYVNNVPLVLGIGFFVDPLDGSSDRTVTLTEAPPAGQKILVSVRTNAQYRVTGNVLTFLPSTGLNPPAGSLIGVTTFNDTSQQDIFTKVYVGPVSQGLQITEGYDDTIYDLGNITGDPGSFDYGAGVIIQTNRFDIGRAITNTDRILVSQDGKFLFHDIDYVIEGTSVVILGAPISANSVIAITSFTNSVVPSAIAFRIFQDMRGVQSLYRITADTSTVLTQALTATADTIHVQDASKLDEPNLPQGLFGLITIDGERIAYRNRNTANNTLSGLRRGTAGTAAAPHVVGAAVLSLGASNLLPLTYQRTPITQNFLGNDSQTVFVADTIQLEDLDSTELVEAVQVFVGGRLQLSGYTVTSSNPVRVEFEQPPALGYQVTIRIQQARVMYQQGVGTASNGVPLQKTDTAAARFIRNE